MSHKFSRGGASLALALVAASPVFAQLEAIEVGGTAGGEVTEAGSAVTVSLRVNPGQTVQLDAIPAPRAPEGLDLVMRVYDAGGELVGEDGDGNRYYRTRGGKIDPTLGFERRWVIYNGLAEASTVPPSWHGWLHHTVDVPPTQDKVVPRPWWKPHRPNLTGTPGAHRPTGSTLAQGRRPKATGDYKAWTPGR